MAEFESSSFSGNVTEKSNNTELQMFLEQEKQKAVLNATIHEFNDTCWEKCVEKIGSKLDGRTENCINNCVNRFLDVSVFITNRFSQMLNSGGLQ